MLEDPNLVPRPTKDLITWTRSLQNENLYVMIHSTTGEVSVVLRGPQSAGMRDRLEYHLEDNGFMITDIQMVDPKETRFVIEVTE